LNISDDPEDLLMEIGTTIYQGVLQIIEKEMDYYKQLESLFIKNAKKLARNRKIDIESEREDVLVYINEQFQNQINDPDTELGFVEDVYLQTGRVRRSPREFKNAEGDLK
jgi:hypothetical protein